MCLIIASKTGKKIDDAIVMQGFSDNPDSWGIMRADGERVLVEKGLTLASFEKAYELLDDSPYVIHFRWATHGAKNTANAHPFKLTRGLYMAHNGVLGVETTNKAMSDTWHYVQMLKRWGLTEKNVAVPENIESMANQIGASNKLAFLTASGDITIVNEDKGVIHDGVWLSNDYSLWADDDFAPYSGYSQYFARKYGTPKRACCTKSHMDSLTVDLLDDWSGYGDCDLCFTQTWLTETVIDGMEGSVCDECFRWASGKGRITL